MGNLTEPLHAEVEKDRSMGINEVIDGAYRKVVDKYGVKEVKFKKPLSVRAFEYVDEHDKTKARPGTCGELKLVDVGNNRWLVGQVGQYGRLEAQGNITAIIVDKDVKKDEELVKHFEGVMKKFARIENRNSIIYGDSSGKMDASYHFPEMEKYLAGLDFDGLVLNRYGDCTHGYPPDYGTPIKYSPGMVDALVEGIEKTLAAPPEPAAVWELE
jgi:hypothetical protein